MPLRVQLKLAHVHAIAYFDFQEDAPRCRKAHSFLSGGRAMPWILNLVSCYLAVRHSNVLKYRSRLRSPVCGARSPCESCFCKHGPTCNQQFLECLLNSFGNAPAFIQVNALILLNNSECESNFCCGQAVEGQHRSKQSKV